MRWPLVLILTAGIATSACEFRNRSIGLRNAANDD
jgi:hypothetical protein